MWLAIWAMTCILLRHRHVYSPHGLSSAIVFYNDTLADIVEKHTPK